MGCKPSTIGTVRVAPAAAVEGEGFSGQGDQSFQTALTPTHSTHTSHQSSLSNLQGQSSRPNSKSGVFQGRGHNAAKRAATPLRGTRSTSGKLRSTEVVVPTGLPIRPPSSRPPTVKQQNIAVLSPEGEFFDPMRFTSQGEVSKNSPTQRKGSSLSRRQFSMSTRRTSSAVSGTKESPGSQHSGDVYHLKLVERGEKEFIFLHCPSCGQRYTSAGFAVPHVLHCGHTYCSSCLEKAGQGLPHHLQCGLCHSYTVLDTQGSLNLPKNSVLLEIIESKRLSCLMLSGKREKCAECESCPATLYCNLCSAVFCNACSAQTHSFSKVRAKHHPIPIKLKPGTQPVCSRHPGQPCMLYCETEGVPMCVLCKFYGQHRFHSYELLNQAAGKYTIHLTEELRRLEEIDRKTKLAVDELGEAGSTLVESARKCEEKLEKHFAELREQVLSSLERRETVLLSSLDHQVELHQEMIAQQREELALMRAKLIATTEEAKQLLQLDPISTLLERQHVDKALQQLQDAPVCPLEEFVHSEISLSLPHDIGPSLSSKIKQHGSVSRLPPKLVFVSVNVTKTTITLYWSPITSTANTNSTSLLYDLQCYMDLPKGFPHKAAGVKMVNPLQTPSRESGFEDGSAGPSGSVSMVTVGSGRQVGSPTHHPTSLGINPAPTSHPGPLSMLASLPATLPGPTHLGNEGRELYEEETPCTSSHGTTSLTRSGLDSSWAESNRTSLLLEASGRGRGVKHLLSDAIRLPQPTTSQQHALPTGDFPPPLNLPPLIHHEHDEEHINHIPSNEDHTPNNEDKDGDSDSSGVLGDVEDFGRNITSSLSNSRTGTALGLPPLRKTPSNPGIVMECDPMEGACVGFQFEQVYTGSKTQYIYSGVIPTATYYFKVRCRNNAGWGPWSSVIKCSLNKKN